MSYNMNNDAIKRLLREVKDIEKRPNSQFLAAPLADNLFEWHFTIRGPPDTAFADGIYHGRLLFPPEYPFKPPNIMLLTPNGRFDVKKKICLSMTAYHQETWQPSWSIETMLLAIISFMPTDGDGAIGALDYTPSERQRLAKDSLLFCCEDCQLTMRKADEMMKANAALAAEAPAPATPLAPSAPAPAPAPALAVPPAASPRVAAPQPIPAPVMAPAAPIPAPAAPIPAPVAPAPVAPNPAPPVQEAPVLRFRPVGGQNPPAVVEAADLEEIEAAAAAPHNTQRTLDCTIALVLLILALLVVRKYLFGAQSASPGEAGLVGL